MNSIETIIKKKAPLKVEDFLNIALYHKGGYYDQRHVIGRSGDFITSPEISQCFGDLIVCFFLHFMLPFIEKGESIIFMELGPGKGTLLSDVLRQFRKYPQVKDQINILLYEHSDYLKKVQQEKLRRYDFSLQWIDDFNNLPPHRLFVFSNEFFDALPIAQKSQGEDVYVTLTQDQLMFSHTKNIEEIPQVEEKIVAHISEHILKYKGGILTIDYGYSENNKHISTLQALYNHRRCDVFENLGQADISHHVNFSRLKKQFEHIGLTTDSIISQKDFLMSLGLEVYIEKLLHHVPASHRSNFISGATRLISPHHMGEIFKVLWAYKDED